MVSDQFNPKVKGDGLPQDHVEEITDGGGEVSREQLQAAADQLNSAAGGEPPPQQTKEVIPPAPELPPSVSKRLEITNRQAANRMKDMVEGVGFGPVGDEAPDPSQDLTSQRLYMGEFGDDSKNFMGETIPPAPEAPAPAPDAAPSIPAQEPGVDDGDLVTVKVGGVETQVSQSELIRNYQVGQAADQRLSEATELLRNAQGVAAASLSPTSAPPVNEAEAELPTETTSEPGLDDIDFAAITEKIQLGETNEGAEALKDLVVQVAGKIGRQDNAPVDPAALVEQAAHVVRDRTQSEAALKTFEETYPDIVADPQLYQLASRNAVDAMIEDFETCGADPEMIAFAKANPAQAANAHRAMRTSGRFEDLRNPEQLYVEAGNRTRDWMAKISGQQAPTGEVLQPTVSGQPAPPPRRERARNAQQSPAQRQAPPAPPQQQPVAKTPSQVIAEMKRARGQFPAGQQAAGRR